MEFSKAVFSPASTHMTGIASAELRHDITPRGRVASSERFESTRLMDRRVSPPGVADGASFCFVDDPLSRQRVIDQLHRASPAVVCIGSPADLERNGLLMKTVLDGGQLHKTRGRLFTDEPLTLIIDLCAMTPGRIASFNDLLESDPHCNGQPLGRHIRRVLLVNTDMLQGRQISNSDLWRRLGQMEERSVPPADDQSVTDETLLAQITTAHIPGNKPMRVIDFALSDDWHHALFGGITLNRQGELIFAAGALANLATDTHLVLRNAPSNGADFQTALATAVRYGGFTANGQWVPLPGGLTLSSEPFCPSRLEQLKQHMLADNAAFDPTSPFACLNPVMVDSIKGTLRIEGTKVVQANLLSALVADCRQLVITAPLSDKQWYWLLRQLELLATPPALFIDVPPLMLLGDRAKEMPDGAFTYRVSVHDSQESLQQSHLTSQRCFTFELTNSLLLQHLMAGKPVILTNLEQNPQFAACIETLLLPHPYLFLHGHKIALPQVNLTVVSGNCGSALIDQRFSAPDKLPQNPLYRLLLGLPALAQKRYPVRLPWEEDEFNRLFEQQSDAQRRFDGSPVLLPCHQRQALHILLAKAYRGDARVYGYVKAKIAELFPDQSAEHRADRSGLRRWLTDHPKPNRELLKRHFWALARHCPTSVYRSLEFGNKPTDDALDQLAIYLAGAAPPQRQRVLTRGLHIGMHELDRVQFYDGVVRSTLRDALVAGKAWLPPGTVLSQMLAELARQLETVLSGPEPEQKKLLQVQEILTPLLKQWPPSWQDLPSALIRGQRHAHSRRERRLIHLAERVKEHPVVFLQGPAGVGKSFMAETIAGQAGFSACQLVQLGPGQTRDTLCGGPELLTTEQDSSTRFKPGTLIQWASESDKPPLLVLDEANLAPEGTLAPLAALSRPSPSLDLLGNQYLLSKAHRIILTGNPCSYPGRNPLALPMPTLYYHEPDQAQMQAFILSRLPSWPEACRQVACDRLLTLLHHFKEIVELTSIRDLNDVLATMRQILRYHVTPDLSEGQINALVYRAFMDSLAGAVLPGPQLDRLRYWYQGQFAQDTSVLTGVDNAFNAFLTQLQAQNPDACFTPSGVRQLVYRYWQSLDKGNSGRCATLVEGPSGWGKDFVLNRTIGLWQQQQGSERPFIHINASPNRWSALVASVHRAMDEGLLIAISELNLIGSADLEELLNLALTRRAVAGFHLFATINPSSFVGREVLSPALKSRCTQMRLSSPSLDELMVIVQALSRASPELCRWLAIRFHQLSAALNNQHSPVQLVLDDLLSSARHLTGYPPQQWADAFQQHLALATRSLSTPLSTETAEDVHQTGGRDELERIANGLPELVAPVSIRFGNANDFSNERIVIVVPEITPAQLIAELKTRVNRRTSLLEKAENKRGRVLFGNIIAPRLPPVTGLFPTDLFNPGEYRLELAQTQLDEDGELSTYPILWSMSPLTPLEVDDWRTQIREDELPGRVELFLSGQWHSLPGLTPEDQLRAIRVSPPVAVDLARSQRTGQLLVRRRHDGEPDSVVVDFIIAPQMKCFNPLEERHRPVTCEYLCTPQLQALLDENVFYPTGSCCQAFKELQTINRVSPLPHRLLELIRWLDTFDASCNITGKGGQLLLNILSQKQGVCRHKAMIFQLFCHYWEIPARTVTNVIHCFVEVSFDGGSSWRCYQVGGAGRTHKDVTGPDWSQYNQTAGAQLRRHRRHTLPCALPSQRDCPSDIVRLASKILREYISLPLAGQRSGNGELPKGWVAFLSPTFFNDAREDIIHLSPLIVKSLMTLEQLLVDRDLVEYFEAEHQVSLIYTIYKNPDMVNDAWLNWLCGLYQFVPDFAKRFVLGILQWATLSGELRELSQTVAQMTLNHPLAPEEFRDSGYFKGNRDEVELDNLYRSVAETLPASPWLSDKLTRYSITRQFHYYPGDNSVLVPEKMLSGGPAFLHQTTAEHYKTVIFDLVSVSKMVLQEQIMEQIKKGIKPRLVKMLVPDGTSEDDLCVQLEMLFFYWLASHQGSNSLGPIWLCDHYRKCFVGTQLGINHFIREVQAPTACLPSQVIKEYFCQPDAEVVDYRPLRGLMKLFVQLISV